MSGSVRGSQSSSLKESSAGSVQSGFGLKRPRSPTQELEYMEDAVMWTSPVPDPNPGVQQWVSHVSGFDLELKRLAEEDLGKAPSDEDVARISYRLIWSSEEERRALASVLAYEEGEVDMLVMMHIKPPVRR